MKLNYLWHGLPGHPLHPPLTDATIGSYTVATVAGLASVVGVAHITAAHAWWIALVVGLIVTSLTALTGFADWLTIEWGSPIWWTATWHMASMLTATVFFLIAALVGFVFLTVGGWLGGAVVFVHGMRVLSLVDEPPARAMAPAPHPEKEEAQA